MWDYYKYFKSWHTYDKIYLNRIEVNMKKIIIVMLMFLLLFPVCIYAKPQALGLEDTLKDEGISIAFDGYSETEEQVIVYLFRGAGCIHCHDFLEFLNEFAKENGALFKLRSYEVYNNTDNNDLKKKIAEYFGDRAGGVPYIIIGDKTFYGYAKDDASTIEEAIKEAYQNSERYDVFEKMDNNVEPVIAIGSDNQDRQPKKSNKTFAIIILILMIIFCIPILFSNLIFRSKKKDKISK